MLIRAISLIVVGAALLACSQGSSGAPSDPGTGPVKFTITGDQKADWAQIVALETEAKALVDTTGCASSGECRTAPVGSRGCGGPRYYLVYCSKTTDSVALFNKLAAVSDAERQYNTNYKIVSTCEFRMPPTVGLSGGSCRAQPSTNGVRSMNLPTTAATRTGGQ
jgi:hypothetical protein